MVLMQMTQNNFQVKSDFSVKQQSVNSTNQGFEKFGSVLNQAISSNNSNQQDASKQNGIDEKSTLEVLEAHTLEEAVELFDFEADAATLQFVVDGESVGIEELLTTDNLAALLNIDMEQLQQLLAQLTDEQVDVTDIWNVLEAAPNLIATLVTQLQNDEQAEGNEELLKFLKLAQLVGEKQDTVYSQQYTLTMLKEALQQATNQLASFNQVEQPKQQTSFSAVQQIIQATQNEQKVTVSAQSSNSNNESLLQQNAQPTGLQNTLGVKTVTVNLPSNPASQSEAIAKEIQNLLNKNQVANNNGTLKLVLKLFPENLGQIRIEVAQQNGVMTARLLASTAAGKELLDSNLNQLKATFVSQNIQMERIDITQSLQDPEKNYKEQGMFKQFFNQREEDDQESDAESDEEQKTFSEFLEEEVQ